MENYYLDRWRSNLTKLQKMRAHSRQRIDSRPCLVIGSAPDPVIPQLDNPFIVCVNGSVHSAYRYCSRPPDLTYLNGALFADENLYSEATRGALRGKNLGDLLIARNAIKQGLATLREIECTHGESHALSKYDKRVILGESFGASSTGIYPLDANVSNGLFMAAYARWCCDSPVVLAGFSMNSRHEYSQNSELSPRGHLIEDRIFFNHIARLDFRIFTTSQTLHEQFGVRIWRDSAPSKSGC